MGIVTLTRTQYLPTNRTDAHPYSRIGRKAADDPPNWTPVQRSGDAMIHVIGRFVVRDLVAYATVHASTGLEIRRGHGCFASHLYGGSEGSYAMAVVLSWPSRAVFDAFEVDPAVRDCMRLGGMLTAPVFTTHPVDDLPVDEALAEGLEEDWRLPRVGRPSSPERGLPGQAGGAVRNGAAPPKRRANWSAQRVGV